MVNESRKNSIRVIAWLTLAAGMMLILDSIHSTGVALEKMILSVSSSTLLFIGVGLVLAAAIIVAILFISEKK